MAATPVNSGFAACTYCHEYVGNTSFFAISQIIFDFPEAQPFSCKVDPERAADGIGDLTSVIEQVDVILLVRAGYFIQALHNPFRRVAALTL